MSNLSDKPWLVPGHMYQYDIGWLVEKLISFETELNTAIDLKTIHYADPIQWDITTQYSPNTVVVDPKTGTAYMSKVPVPAGVLLTNTDYWVVIFNYQRIYDKIMSGVAFNDKDKLNASKDLLANDLVWFGGDLYRCTRAIPQGTTYLPGTNLTPTTIADCLAAYYGRDRVAQLLNDTVNVSGGYTLNAGYIAETASNVTIHSTQDMVLDADGNLTEQVTGGKTSEIGGKLTERVTGSREIDVDGDDSLHIDGASTVNVGGLRTEVYAGSRTTSIEGTSTEHYKGAANIEYDSTFVFSDSNNKRVNMSHRSVNVKDYGATGNGTTDDYQAFVNAIAQTTDGDYIVIPQGIYYLSANPYPISDNTISTDPAAYSTGYRNFIVSSGAQFKGAAIGSPTTGAGKFFSAFSTNPWLVIAGNNDLYNLNHVDPSNAQKGAIIGDCKELASVDTTVPAGVEHRWYALEYRGANTGNTKNTSANVELLNQVINVTGCTGVATEIDLNNFTNDTGAFSVGLFITGGGTGKSSMTAIDINKDDIATDWVSGVNIRRASTCVSGTLVDNGVGAQFTRHSDDTPSGFFIMCLSAAQSPLFRVDANGYVFGAGYFDNNNNPIHNPVVIDAAASGTYTNQEVVIPITIPAGYSYGIATEAASVGFDARVTVLMHTDTNITLYVSGSGTGTVKCRVLCI